MGAHLRHLGSGYARAREQDPEPRWAGMGNPRAAHAAFEGTRVRRGAVWTTTDAWAAAASLAAAMVAKDAAVNHPNRGRQRAGQVPLRSGFRNPERVAREVGKEKKFKQANSVFLP